MIKKLTGVIMSLLFTLVCVNAQDMIKADKLFAAGQYQAAHDEYIKLAAENEQPADMYKAQLRSAECLKNLNRYEEAAKLFATYKLPSDPVWEARFLLYKTFFAQQNINAYGYAMSADEEEGNEDLGKQTKNQWQDAIKKDYERLFALRKELINEPIQNEGLIVNLKDTDLETTPTLYDFSAGKIKDFYQEQGNKEKVKMVIKETADLDGVNRTLAKQNALIDFTNYTLEGEEKVSALSKLAGYDDKFAPAAAQPAQSAPAQPAAKKSILKKITGFFSASKKEEPVVEDPVSEDKPAYKPAVLLPGARARALYTAAQMVEAEGKNYQRAYEMYAYIDKQNLDTYYTEMARRQAEEMQRPVLDMAAQPIAQNPKNIKYSANLRNIDMLYTRVYATSQKELLAHWPSYRKSYDYLRNLSNDSLKYFLAKEPVALIETPVKYGAKYEYKDVTVSVPEQENGLYIVINSDKKDTVPGKSEVRANILNLSDIMLLSSSGIEGKQEDFTYDTKTPNKTARANVFEFYVLNPLTGAPILGSAIDAYEGYDGTTMRSLTTGPDGTASADMSINLNYTNYRNNLALDPLAQKNGAIAFLQSMVYFNFQTEQPYLVFVETDRAIYRPEQEVSLKATVLERTPKGYKTLEANRKIKIEVYDANYKLLTTGNTVLSDMGSASYKFAIPSGRLLGDYSINVSLTGTNGAGHANFKVEEYKRPEFEVNIKDAASTWTYGEKTKIEGSAVYYFGGPVADADVEYKVFRENYIPYFCWWWRRPAGDARTEVMQGKIKADAEGKFNFDFTPAGTEPSSRFTVEINARDAGGRTISANKNFLGAKENLFFKVEIPTGFMTANQDYDIGLTVVDINETPIEAKSKVQIYSLENTYKEPKDEAKYYWQDESTAWESAFEDTKEIEEVYMAEVPAGKRRHIVTIPALKEGVYRMKITSGVQEQKMLLISVYDGKTLALPSVAIAERTKYYPGETMRVLLGADKIQTAKYFKIIKNSFVLEKNIVNAPGVSLVEVAIKEEHRGGFNISFFGVSGYKTYTSNTAVDVPRNNLNLDVKVDAPAAVKPGEKVTWKVTARDFKGNPVAGEATIRVYDRSLDYYAKLEPAIKLDSLYYDSVWRNAARVTSSLFSAYPASDDYDREWKAYPEQKPAVHLNMEYSYRSYGGRTVHRMASATSVKHELMADMALEESSAAPMAMNAMAKEKSAVTGAADKGVDAMAAEGGAVRENMAETAFFAPQIKLLNGAAAFAFTMPERLTGWNILANVLTKDVKLGTVTAQTVTKKDLMVRLEMPRYLREKDKAQIKALINNDTKNPITADVSLLVKQAGQNAYETLGLANNTKKVTIPAGGQSVVVWEANVASGTRILSLTAVARALTLTDGETKELPILPSRERIVDSKVMALKEGKNTLALNLPADKTREYEAISLQVDPSLLLPVLNTVPMLIDYAYCFETIPSIVSKYVPLAVMNSFYNKYPALKTAVSKIPKRDTITPAWEQEDPSRLLMLQETPWQGISEGRSAFYGKIIDIFNPKTVAKIEDSSIDKLKNYQNADGSYSWLPGGRGDEYITLYVLEGFAEAVNHEARVPADTAKKAIKYVTPKIEDLLKKSAREDEYSVSMALYAAYVISSFPDNWYEKKTISAWAEFASTQEQFMTPLGRLYAANIYHRLGNKELSDRYLESVLDMLRVDANTGAYFTPEAKSWLWYSDTLEKQAMAIRTLIRLRPEDKKIDDLLKWLLFNRKATEWKSTKAAASSVYAMLDVMKAKGAFTTDSSYNIVWGNVKEQLTYKPFDFVAKPPMYSVYGASATDKNLSAEITKTGKIADFASVTAVYSTDALVEKSDLGLLNVDRKYFNRVKEDDVYKLKPLASGDTVSVGDEIVVQLLVKTSSQFEYVLIKDPRGAGFEASTLLSGWKWDLLSRYEEQKDSSTNFFVSWLPHGEYTLSYTIRPTTKGEYKVGAAVIQSMFAPEFAAHSSSMTIKVK